MVENFFDFAILAFTQAQSQPDIVALLAFKFRFNRPVMHAVDCHAIAQRVQISLSDFAIGPYAIAAQPAGIGQLDHA